MLMSLFISQAVGRHAPLRVSFYVSWHFRGVECFMHFYRCFHFFFPLPCSSWSSSWSSYTATTPYFINNVFIYHENLFLELETTPTSKTGNLWYVWFSRSIRWIYSIYAKHLQGNKGGIWIHLTGLNHIMRTVSALYHNRKGTLNPSILMDHLAKEKMFCLVNWQQRTAVISLNLHGDDLCLQSTEREWSRACDPFVLVAQFRNGAHWASGIILFHFKTYSQ